MCTTMVVGGFLTRNDGRTLTVVCFLSGERERAPRSFRNGLFGLLHAAKKVHVQFIVLM